MMFILMYFNRDNGKSHESFHCLHRPLTLEEANQKCIDLNDIALKQGINGHYYTTPILDI